jgi:integrase/recombinase XerC
MLRLKPATVNRRLHALRRFCRWAVRAGWLPEDPSEEVQTIRTGRRGQPRGLQEAEVHALLRAAGQSGRGLAKRNYALVQLMLQTGLRVGEVAALKRADLMVYDRSGSVRVREGKGRKDREVPLNATVRRALTLYWKSLESVKPEDPLFASERGSPMSLRSMQAIVSELGRRAQLRRLPVSAHTLRHTFALGYLRENPGKLVELANLLGHDSLDTTALYTQPSREDLAESLERSPWNVDG